MPVWWYSGVAFCEPWMFPLGITVFSHDPVEMKNSHTCEICRVIEINLN